MNRRFDHTNLNSHDFLIAFNFDKEDISDWLSRNHNCQNELAACYCRSQETGIEVTRT